MPNKLLTVEEFNKAVEDAWDVAYFFSVVIVEDQEKRLYGCPEWYPW